MIVARRWAGRRYAVLGLARSGTATVAALEAGGADVTAWDADEARRLPFLRETVDAGTLTLAPLDDVAGFDALVVSPGVPLNTHPLADKARAARVPIRTRAKSSP